MGDALVSVSQLAEHPDNHHLTWNLPLPDYVDSDRLVAHLPTVNTLGYWGTLREVTVIPGKLNSDDELSVGDIGGGTEATATAATSSSLQPVRYGAGKLRPSSHPFLTDASITVDVDTIADTLSRKQRLRSTEAWARYINRAVIAGLDQAVTHNTLRDNGSLLHLQFSLSVFLPLLAKAEGMAFGVPDNSIYNSIPEALVVAGILARPVFLEMVRRAFNLSGRDIPWSIVPFGLDRLMVAKAYGLTHRRPIRTATT